MAELLCNKSKTCKNATIKFFSIRICHLHATMHIKSEKFFHAIFLLLIYVLKHISSSSSYIFFDHIPFRKYLPIKILFVAFFMVNMKTNFSYNRKLSVCVCSFISFNLSAKETCFSRNIN